MAKTVIGYFANDQRAQTAVQQLLEAGYEPTYINIISKAIADSQKKTRKGSSPVDAYDNTFEAGGPVAEYKEALFDADLTEEDAIYYQSEVSKGSTLIAAYVPTDREKGREWELEVGEEIEDVMKDNSAYDTETRAIYSNRGMTTYPQNRYMDPLGANSTRDRVYRSASPLNADLSNVIGQRDNTPEDIEVDLRAGGLKVRNAGDSKN